MTEAGTAKARLIWLVCLPGHVTGLGLCPKSGQQIQTRDWLNLLEKSLSPFPWNYY